MTNIVVKIRDGEATAELTGILTNGMVGVPVFFDLGPEWEDLTVIAVIRGNDLTFDRPLLGTRQTTVPFEVLEKVGEHIYIGAEGCSASGDLVIQSNMAEVEETVRQGADPSGDIAMDPTQPFWAELMHEVEELRKGVAERVKTVNGVAPDENGEVMLESAGGISDFEKALILSLLRNAAYTADMSATFAQLAELWGIEVPDEPVVPDEPDIPDEPVEPHTHSYTSSVTKDATCDTAGVRTYTCSCGHSYTEAIPAIGHNYVDGTCTKCGEADPNYDAGGEEETEQTEPVYTLAEATAFNADKVVDTGYKLLDVDKSWSVCVDHNDAARGGNVWDASPNASQGLALTNRGGYFRILMVAGSLYKDIGTVVGNYKTIVTHTKNTDVVNYYFVLPNTTNLVSGEITYTKYLTDSNIISVGARTVKLGGRYDGTTADYKGTINRFEIYERVLSEAEIYAFAGAEVPEGVTDYVTIPCTVPTDNIVAGEINDAGAIAEKATAYVADSYIKVTAGGSYVVDATEFFAVQAYDTWVECAWYDSSGIYISQNIKKLTTADKTMTVTALGNAEYMKVGISCDTATADNASTYFSHISISEVK